MTTKSYIMTTTITIWILVAIIAVLVGYIILLTIIVRFYRQEFREMSNQHVVDMNTIELYRYKLGYIDLERLKEKTGYSDDLINELLLDTN